MKRILLGLGSNLGNRQLYLDEAVIQLQKLLSLKNIKKSAIYKNPAMLLPDSPPEWDQEFFNIALSADIDLKEFSPKIILKIIKEIEKKLGRKNIGKWAPRQIDIDILAIEDLVVNKEELKIPHPALFERDFFVKTAIEIESDWLQRMK